MNEKKKIEIKPKPQQGNNLNKEIDNLRNEIKSLKKRLNQVEIKEMFLDEKIGSNIHLELMTGNTINGTLKNISRYMIDIEVDGLTKHYQKHAILAIWFD